MVVQLEAHQLPQEVAVHSRSPWVFTRASADGILCSAMRDALPATCSLCSKEIAPGTRAVYATVEHENLERVYHPDCFVAFTTGATRDGAIWTYRIVDAPAEEAP